MFVRGRWNWTRFGYEKGFPRGCQFTDVDAAVEFDGRRLVLEPKHYDGIGPLPAGPPTGQMLYLRDEVKLGKVVLVLFGCGVCDDPYAVYDVGREQLFDWRGDDKARRRKRLKRHIDRALGLIPDSDAAIDPAMQEVIWPDVRRPPDSKGVA